MAPLHDDVTWMDRDYFEPFDYEEEEEERDDFWDDEEVFWDLREGDNE